MPDLLWALIMDDPLETEGGGRESDHTDGESGGWEHRHIAASQERSHVLQQYVAEERSGRGSQLETAHTADFDGLLHRWVS